MRNIKILIIVSLWWVFTSCCSIITSCHDEETKQKIAFIELIIAEPEKMEKIITTSSYYNTTYTEAIDQPYYQMLINSIKIYKTQGINLKYMESITFVDTNNNKKTGSAVYISSGNFTYETYLGFFFQKINDQPILVKIYFINNG